MEDTVASAGTTTPSNSHSIPHSPRSVRVHPSPSPLSSSSQLPPPTLPVRSPLRPPARSISNNSATPTLDSDAPLSPKTPPGTDEQDQTVTLPMTTHPMPSTPALRIQMRDREREREREKDRDRDRENAYPYLNELIDPLLATIDSFSVDLLPAKQEREREKDRNAVKEFAPREREREIEKELPERPETPLSIDLEAEDDSSHSHSQHPENDQDDALANPTNFTTSASAAAYMSSYMSSLASTSTSSPSTSTSTSISSSSRSSAPTSITSLSSVSEPQPQPRPQKHDTTATTTTKPPQAMSKRYHAMHELLSSERAYASDLALIREVHIPLALGQTPMLQNIPLSPPPASGSSFAPASTPNLTSASSTSASAFTSTTTTTSNPTSGSSSTRTLSTASDSSTASLGPAMAPEDVKVIFGNVEELALLSDAFADRLEVALGSVLDGGAEGDDTIGALFLECVPMWERPYKQYITRHPSALQHLQNLPQTPALTAYLAYTQRVASALTHAWDLASLLIKPVQRLLKYPLLLHTIIDETPDSHPDKENLKAAKERIEELARNVNEGRRRAEVVKDVLTSKGVKKPSAPVGVSAGVSLSKVKSLRHGGVTAATMRVGSSDALDGSRPGGTGGGSEAALVDALQGELKQIEVFAQQFARNVVDWGKMMSNMMLALRTWALSFAKVIGLALDPHAASDAAGQQQHSEAFDAFVAVIREKLMPLSADLEAAINERLLKDLAHLLGTMTQPLKLLASMGEQEPYHYHLLTMPLSAKNRPPAALLAASTNYLALRGQLAAELPTYLQLLHRGFSVLIRRLAELQTRFWRDVKEHWAELWDMLRVESELNVGWEETCAVWCARWADVDEVVKTLAITGPVPHLQPTPRTYFYTYQLPPSGAATPAAAAAVVASPLVAQQQQQQQPTELAEYFAYPNFYMPMVPAPATPKDRRESGSSGNSNSKLEKHNSKSSGHSGKGAHNSNGNNKDNAAAAATVQSMFAALEPAHSPVHHKKSTINSSSFASSPAPAPAPATASSSTANVASPSGGFVPSMVSSSLFGGGASMYSVSGPLPLGSVPVPRDKKEKERDSRGRGRGASDASSNKAGYGTSGRRPASQDRQYPHYPQSPPPPPPLPQQHMARSPPPQSPPIPARRRTQGHVALADEFAEYVAMHGGALPPPYEGAREYPYSPPSGSGGNGTASSRQGISRMKSMPVSLGGHGNGHVQVDEREERVYRQEPEWEEYDAYAPQHQQLRPQERGRDAREHEQQRDREFDGKRLTKSPKRRSKEQTHSRKRSGSVKSITAFFTSSNPNISSTAAAAASAAAAPQTTASSDPQPLTSAQRDSWASKPAKYFCQVIHPCKPPPSISYYSFPFFTLREGELYEVLQEAGHPSIHPKLPLYVDDGEDCLLLCRDGRGVVGWALASFLEPVDIVG
ncbi:Rho guanine nucleotide exchange factor gef1 [Psilocybe cubensis]|uniref:Rho guanine nucleotide exchange factor gef1 n=2 Tax=Psilocybe cubensis TaxID=181762 RepID=A0ACB8HCS5_PSICU|nr:Rho guanine nucleotide exchange factor gef1 [Psilocybe cubensis]KAH9485619.1 Rho guanine nucleotide exchange factor gef1 [Psilocybe cubensis]